jgi:hypothetical protein
MEFFSSRFLNLDGIVHGENCHFIEGSLGGEVLVFAMVTMRSMNDE